MLNEPPPSPWDLHFRAFRFPVRVAPMFWLMTLVLGLNRSRSTPPAELLIWIALVFVSILVHELGHAFTQRFFGGRPWITLYAMGGLASCDDCDRRTSSQILISLAGPAAGFALALIVAAALSLSGRTIGLHMGTSFDPLRLALENVESVTWLPLPLSTLYWESLASDAGDQLVFSLFRINILWGLVNLLPVYPLDGGRISRELCTLRDVQGGIVLSLRISLITAIAMAVFALFAWESFFVAIMFGYMAYMNYQTLQRYQESRW
jgi:stage IV sporulation protein FB